MKFRYGKQDWKTFERGEENCYLMTNGLGGFSSLTAIGSCSRNDHAVLMACVKSPNHRCNMIHRLEELLRFGEGEIYISSQDYKDGEDSGAAKYAGQDADGGETGCVGQDADGGETGCAGRNVDGGAAESGQCVSDSAEGCRNSRKRREEGYLYQTGFSYEDYPERFRIS